jgi:glycosyltransferase involved in cell wall biosynthesis
MTGVAIVIPMLNEVAGLPRLLRSLVALEPPPAEVLAVDGGSTDGSAPRARCYKQQRAITFPARQLVGGTARRGGLLSHSRGEWGGSPAE